MSPVILQNWLEQDEIHFTTCATDSFVQNDQIVFIFSFLYVALNPLVTMLSVSN
jgi:hypothetical protein